MESYFIQLSKTGFRFSVSLISLLICTFVWGLTEKSHFVTGTVSMMNKIIANNLRKMTKFLNFQSIRLVQWHSEMPEYAYHLLLGLYLPIVIFGSLLNTILLAVILSTREQYCKTDFAITKLL